MTSHFFLLDHIAVYDIKLRYSFGSLTRPWDWGKCVIEILLLKQIVPIAGGREKVKSFTISILGFKKLSLLISSMCHV